MSEEVETEWSGVLEESSHGIISPQYWVFVKSLSTAAKDLKDIDRVAAVQGAHIVLGLVERGGGSTPFPWIGRRTTSVPDAAPRGGIGIDLPVWEESQRFPLDEAPGDRIGQRFDACSGDGTSFEVEVA